MLIRSLGAEAANDILENKTESTKCLSVPLLKRGELSVTDPSDTTSLCSISSIKHDSTRKRQTPTTPISQHASEPSPKHDAVPLAHKSPAIEYPNNGVGARSTRSDQHSVKSVEFANTENQSTLTRRKETVINGDMGLKEGKCSNGTPPVAAAPTAIWNQPQIMQQPIEHSLNQVRRLSMRTADIDVNNGGGSNMCHRRVSVPTNNLACRGAQQAGKKIDFSGHVVSKSELWDTGNQHRCAAAQKHKAKVNIVSQPDVTQISKGKPDY